MGSLGPSHQHYSVVEGCVPHNSAHSSSSGSLANLSDTTTVGFLVALHRKMVNSMSKIYCSLAYDFEHKVDLPFLDSTRNVLFVIFKNTT